MDAGRGFVSHEAMTKSRGVIVLGGATFALGLVAVPAARADTVEVSPQTEVVSPDAVPLVAAGEGEDGAADAEALALSVLVAQRIEHQERPLRVASVGGEQHLIAGADGKPR